MIRGHGRVERYVPSKNDVAPVRTERDHRGEAADLLGVMLYELHRPAPRWDLMAAMSQIALERIDR